MGLIKLFYQHLGHCLNNFVNFVNFVYFWGPQTMLCQHAMQHFFPHLYGTALVGCAQAFQEKCELIDCCDCALPVGKWPLKSKKKAHIKLTSLSICKFIEYTWHF